VRACLCFSVCVSGVGHGVMCGECGGGAFMGSVCVCVTLQMLPAFTVILSTDLPNSHFSGLTQQSSKRKGEQRLRRNQEGHNCLFCEEMETDVA